MGSDVLSGREGVDYIYGEEGRDHLLAHASSAGLLEEDLYDGGTGHDKVDYTNAVLASGNGISIEVNSTGNGWAQAWNGASVSGLQDDLVSIEDVTLSGANDRFERTSRPTQFFAVIDGGDGSDTAVYTESSSGINDIVIDRRVTGETTIWDADGNGADRLLNFENVEVGGWSVVLPDASVSTGSGVYVNPDRDYVDYSGTTVAAVMVLNNDNTGMMNSSVTLGSVEHNLLTTRWSGVPTLHTQITGTNYGDTINIYSAQNGTKDGNYSSFRVITGAGDDTVYVDNAASEPTVTTGYDIRVTYTGGNDVYDFDVPISEIRLANTIMLSDVSVDILSSGGNSVTAELEIANHGTLTFSLSHISATSMSVRLETGGTITINTNGTYSTSGSSTAASVVEGTWGDDIWLGRSTAEAYYGKDGDDTINGGGGNDLLNGGAGDDTYVFGTNFSSSTAGDRITERDVNGGTD